MSKVRWIFGGLLLLCLLVLYNSDCFSFDASLPYQKFMSLSSFQIAIVVVVEPNSTQFYTRALDSLKCYSQIHGYTFILADTSNYKEKCPHKDKFFRRHCVVEEILPKYDYILFLDADIGVMNPKRRIEEFIDPDYDVTFYDRFYNQEIMAGAYLLKNTPFALEFIKGFADYEYRLPNSFHGTDNGAIEIYIAEKVFSDRPEEYKTCQEVWNQSTGYQDLFAYEACIRSALGATENFPNIRILRKGTGWARDGWTTNSIWDPSRDFMFHGWKTSSRVVYKQEQLPIKPTHGNTANWYDPTIGPFDFDKCLPGNTTWNHDPNLISTNGDVQRALDEYWADVQKDFYRKMAHISKKLKYDNK